MGDTSTRLSISLQAMLVRYSLPAPRSAIPPCFTTPTPPPRLCQPGSADKWPPIIEAGLKKRNLSSPLKRHLVRSRSGMQLQEQFALFAANFIRWAAAWARSILRQANHNFERALGQPKSLCAASFRRTCARWVCNALGTVQSGPFADRSCVFPDRSFSNGLALVQSSHRMKHQPSSCQTVRLDFPIVTVAIYCTVLPVPQ